MDWKKLRASAGPLAVLGLIYALAFLHADEAPLEDAFISFRVLENLVAGDGLVYNPGERVEAHSNLLWILLLAPLRLAFGDVIVAAKLLGFVTGLGALVLAEVLLRPLLREPWERFTAVLAIALSPHFISFTVYGLETPLSYLLLLGAALALARKREGWVSVCMGLLALNRPEGFIYFGVLTVAAFFYNKHLVLNGRWWIPFLLLFGGVTLFRLLYYGLPLPNTVYAKGIGSMAITLPGAGGPEWWLKLRHGAGQIVQFFAQNFTWPLLVLWVYSLVGVDREREGRTLLGLWAMVAATVIFLLLTGGNFFGRYRFWSVAVPPLLLLAALGAARVNRPWLRWGCLSLLVVLSLVGVERTWDKGPYWARQLSRPVAGESFFGILAHRIDDLNKPPDTLNRRLGDWLRETHSPGTLIATGQVGQIGYYSMLPILDVVGLADSHVAREGVSLEYLIEEHDPAAFLVLGDRFWKQFLPETFKVSRYPEIYTHPEFRRRYEWRAILTGPPPHESFFYFTKRPQVLDEAPAFEDPPVLELPLDEPLEKGDWWMVE